MMDKKQHNFKCPNCGEDIAISEVLASQIRLEIQSDFDMEKEKALEDSMKRAENKFNLQLKERETRLAMEMADLQAQLVEKNKIAELAQEAELEIRKKTRLLEQKQKEMDVELQRRLDAEKNSLAQDIRKQLDQEFHFQLKEKEKQIDDLRASVAEVKRKSEVGSQELQGELLENDLETKLSQTFPQDNFLPVSKGVRGADILQEVINESQKICGTIIWEAKNAKRWSQGWIEKLKDDQRSASATFSVIVTSTLPDGINQFGQIDGVWVCNLHSYLGLTLALRKHLIDLSFVRQASLGKNEKVEMIYGYLSGEEFKQRIEAIVESFNAMQEQLIRERRAMEKIWKEREKQIDRMANNTVGMYGEMRGIIGSGLPTIKSLELDDSD